MCYREILRVVGEAGTGSRVGIGFQFLGLPDVT